MSRNNRGNPNPKQVKRTKSIGWSKDAARRNRAFLYSVNNKLMSKYHGTSFTLTVGDVIPTPKDFHYWIDGLIKYCKNRGAVAGHWVIEWQRRGAPHLHGMIFWDHRYKEFDAHRGLIEYWLERSAKTHSLALGQDTRNITDILVWEQYLAKHAALH